MPWQPATSGKADAGETIAKSDQMPAKDTAPMQHKVLVADDEPAIVRLTQMTLERNGYAVVSAANGREAVEKARETLPDIVLMDIMMPDMDGFEALRQLKSDPATEAIPVVIMSAQSQDAAIVHGMEAGATYYLPKPVNPAELLRIIRETLAPREQVAE